MLAIENSYVFNAILWLDAQKILVNFFIREKTDQIRFTSSNFFLTHSNRTQNCGLCSMSKNATFIQSFSIMSADNVDDDDPNQINEVKSESMWAMAKRDKFDIFNA